jgi:hypothetical protein
MIWLFLYAVACIGLAAYNNDLINEGKKILHFWNGLCHVTFAVLIAWRTHEWSYFFAVLCIARVFFDVSLNIWRGLPLDYISPEVKRYENLKEAFKKGKVVDFIEYKLFKGNGYIPKILYLGITVAIIITVQLK